MSGQPNTLTASKQEQATRALAKSEVYLFLARGFLVPPPSQNHLKTNNFNNLECILNRHFI